MEPKPSSFEIELISQDRIRLLNEAPLNSSGEYVLYWMQMYRRFAFNHALEYAVERANELRKPLLIFEGLRCDYPWASDRIHRFILEGMEENAAMAADRALNYYPYVESAPHQGRGLLERLARDAALVVTDDYPAFVCREHNERAARVLRVCLMAVDSNGMIPLSLSVKAPYSAYQFRRLMQKRIGDALLAAPAANPLSKLRNRKWIAISKEIRARWPAANLQHTPALISKIRMDHSVSPVGLSGTRSAALRRLRKFCSERLSGYADSRNHPDAGGTSLLSPYLHFGKISTHEIVEAVLKKQPSKWSLARLRYRNGSRDGFWNGHPSVDAFLDQLITWREVGFHFCRHVPNYDRFDSLPEWAKNTLSRHARDRRSHVYDLDAFETARTHDPLWNAAQCQLLQEGVIHNYLRMLWGKKILEWSPDPRTALEIMIRLNDRYALDGRDPNSYSGIGWVLGRFDRPWGPERPVYGMVRSMSSENTARKLKLRNYLARYNESK